MCHSRKDCRKFPQARKSQESALFGSPVQCKTTRVAVQDLDSSERGRRSLSVHEINKNKVKYNKFFITHHMTSAF